MFSWYFSLFSGGISLLVYLSLAYYGNEFCPAQNSWCPVTWHDWKDAIWFGAAFLFAIPLYFIPVRYFYSWFRFAIWDIPLSIAIIMWLQTGVLESSGGWINLDSMLTHGLVWLLVVIFFLGSLIQLLREWRKANREQYGS